MPDGGAVAPSRARWPWDQDTAVARYRCRDRSRTHTAGDPGPLARWQAADGGPGARELGELQRRNLQLPRAARSPHFVARSAEPRAGRVEVADRYGSDPQGLRSVGAGLRPTVPWDVRLCSLGSGPAGTVSGSRSFRDQAAVLLPRGRLPALCIGGESPVSQRAHPLPDRPCRAMAISGLPDGAGTANSSPERLAAPTRLLARGDRRWYLARAAILGLTPECLARRRGGFLG